MKMPLVTIAIPFFNVENFILDAVKSIFAQTYQNWELILIDDGSSDNSLSIAKSISDSRVRVISDGQNRKLAYRLNQLSNIASGQYIARMDADDLCSPARIQKQLELMESDPDLDVVGTGICYLDKKDNPVGDTGARTYKTHEEICREPARTFGLCHASVLAKKVWYQKNKYNENIRYGQDFNLWLRTYRHSKFGNVAEPLYYYRLDNSFNLKKQFIVRKDSAIFLYEHYRKYGTFRQALRYAAMQYLKFGATLTLFASGQRQRLMSKRFLPLDIAKLESYRNEISHIKSFKLPI